MCIAPETKGRETKEAPVNTAESKEEWESLGVVERKKRLGSEQPVQGNQGSNANDGQQFTRSDHDASLAPPAMIAPSTLLPPSTPCRYYNILRWWFSSFPSSEEYKKRNSLAILSSKKFVSFPLPSLIMLITSRQKSRMLQRNFHDPMASYLVQQWQQLHGFSFYFSLKLSAPVNPCCWLVTRERLQR